MFMYLYWYKLCRCEIFLYRPQFIMGPLKKDDPLAFGVPGRHWVQVSSLTAGRFLT